ncbi:MAG: hypothetical protein HY740_02425 [Chloroflexi bacterium]|nr:hypothetical protein [Chloroflexota bacterium]
MASSHSSSPRSSSTRVCAVTAPTAARMEALSKEMQSAVGAPKPEQLAQLQELQTRLGKAGLWGAILLVITVVTMAIG